MTQILELKSSRTVTVAFACLMVFAALLTLHSTEAYAATTLHKEGFNNIPAQYVVFDNLDMSAATLTANNTAISKQSGINVNETSDGGKHTAVVWNLKKSGSTSLTDPFSIKFSNAGYDSSTGKRVDLVLTCKNITAQAVYGSTRADTRQMLLYSVVENGKTDLSGIAFSCYAQKGYPNIFAIKQTYDVRVYEAGTTTATSHPLLCYVCDLDTRDGTTKTWTWTGSYAEGINLVSGYGSDTYVATNTKLVAENSNTRFRGTGSDDGTDQSAVAFTLNATGGRFTWTGGQGACSTVLFKSYVKEITATAGSNGSIKASGTNATIAAGKSLTEKVGWRTTKTYTVIPAAGYKIASLKADGNAVSITNSAKQTYTFSNVKANHTFAASFTPITYKIAFNGNGSTSGTMSPMTGLKGATSYTLTANTFKRKGYSFTGWNTKSDGSGTTYKDKAAVKNLTTTDGGTVTLYAQWAPNTITVNYYANGATYDSEAEASVTNQLLKTAVYKYDGTDFAQAGLPNANGGTWNLSKTGYHASSNWLIGDGSSEAIVSADTPFPVIQDFVTAIGKSIDAENATVDLYAQLEPDPFVQRKVVVRIPQSDYSAALEAGYGTPSFVAIHESSRETIRCLIDFSNYSTEDDYVIAQAVVQAPAEATCSLSNTTRFSIADITTDGTTTIFTMMLTGLESQASTASAVNHIVIDNGVAYGESETSSALGNASSLNKAAETQANVEQGQDDAASETQTVEDNNELSVCLAKGSVVNASIPDNAQYVVFTDSYVPENVTLTDLSANGDGSVKGYFDEENATYVITSNSPGQSINTNEDSSSMFAHKEKLKAIDSSNLNFGDAKDLSYLFKACTSLEKVDTTKWNLSKLEDARAMFDECSSLKELVFGTSWSYKHVGTRRPVFPINMDSGSSVYEMGVEIPEGAGTYRAIESATESVTESSDLESDEKTAPESSEYETQDNESALQEQADSNSTNAYGKENNSENTASEVGPNLETMSSEDGQYQQYGSSFREEDAFGD